MNIAILGAGAWGTALAIHFASRHKVCLWTHDETHYSAMCKSRSNEKYLQGFPLPANVVLKNDLADAVATADVALITVPTFALVTVVRQLQSCMHGVPVIWACKGFETATGRLPHQIMAETFPGIDCAALSGPSFAQEVAQGLPAAVTLASANFTFANAMARELHSPRLRIYSSDDVIGVEIGGAVKNVMAIATGISDGMGFGYNARAGLITRGLAEITRFGLKLGGRAETFMGLTGVGDLILTCTGDLSRNRRVGLMRAQQKSLPVILQELGHVAEGVASTVELQRLARHHDVEMPITDAVYKVLYENLPPQQAVEILLGREARAEKNG